MRQEWERGGGARARDREQEKEGEKRGRVCGGGLLVRLLSSTLIMR